MCKQTVFLVAYRAVIKGLLTCKSERNKTVPVRCCKTRKRKTNPCSSECVRSLLFHSEIFKRIASYFKRVSHRRRKCVYRFATCDMELMVISMPTCAQTRYLEASSETNASGWILLEKFHEIRDFPNVSPTSRGVLVDFNARKQCQSARPFRFRSRLCDIKLCTYTRCQKNFSWYDYEVLFTHKQVTIQLMMSMLTCCNML